MKYYLNASPTFVGVEYLKIKKVRRFIELKARVQPLLSDVHTGLINMDGVGEIACKSLFTKVRIYE